jgi:type II secretory pathway component GspD/PulD (secretin)
VPPFSALVVVASALVFSPVAEAVAHGLPGPAPAGEARVSLDAKDAPVTDIVRVLAEAAGFQVVFDPGIDCKLTIKVNAAAWRSLLDTALGACALGVEEEADVLRVAPVARLREEAVARRRLHEERTQRPASRLAMFRLSYARAQQMAPLLERLLPQQARVSYDVRTNTLLVAY